MANQNHEGVLPLKFHGIQYFVKDVEVRNCHSIPLYGNVWTPLGLL